MKKRYDELVKKKKATGELSDEEKLKYGIEIVKEPKQIINEVIDKIKSGEIRDKRAVWNALDVIDEPDSKKLRDLNFYLKLADYGTFNKLFDKKKLQQIEVDW